MEPDGDHASGLVSVAIEKFTAATEGPGTRSGCPHILAGCARITASLTAVPQPAPAGSTSSPFSTT